MRWLILWTAMAGAAFGQEGNFSGTVFDLETGRTQVISGSMSEDDRIAAMRQRTLEGYRRMNAELEVSLANSRQEYELRQQTREMREQTQLLRDIAEEKSSGASSSYVPAPIIVAPSSYVAPSATTPAVQINEAVKQARFAMSFDADTVRRVKSSSSTDYVSNEIITKRLVAAYKGDFTGYEWRSEKVDSQTYFVFCEVLLDGKKYDFKFKVNTAIGSCRYEGGTALAKLAPPQAKSKITFLDEEAPSANPTRGFDPSKPYTIEDPADKEEKFDPDAYLNDSKPSDRNSSAAPQPAGVEMNKAKLKQSRDAGYSDGEIWNYLASKDERFAKARAAGRTLDELAEESSR